MRRSGNCATLTHWKLALLFWIGVSEVGQAQAPAATLPPTQTIRGGGGVTRGGGVTMVGTRASFCGLPLGGLRLSGLALVCGEAKSPLQWMVMLFQPVDGANVPPSTSALYCTVVVWVKCSTLSQSSPNLPPPSADGVHVPGLRW